MTAIQLPGGANYRTNGRFRVFEGRSIIEWGIKIHVAATRARAQQIAHAVLPVLCAAPVRHKVLGDTDMVDTGDEQSKKFITVYPQSGAELDDLLDRINSALIHLQRGRLLAVGSDTITGDMPYGHSGYVFMRYGNFVRDDKDDDRSQVSSKLFDYLMNDTDVFVLTRHAQAARDLAIDQ